MYEILDKAISNLVKNGDLEEFTSRHLIVEYILRNFEMVKKKDATEPKFPVGSKVRHVCTGSPEMVVADYCNDCKDPKYTCTWMSAYPGGINGMTNYQKETETFFEAELRAFQ